MPTYRVTKCDPVKGMVDTYEVGVSAEHENKFKYFQGVVTTSTITEKDIIQTAWAMLEPEIYAWIARVNSGDYYVGSIFTPQEDGTLVFSSN